MSRFKVGDKVIQTPNKPETQQTAWSSQLGGYVGTVFKIDDGSLFVDFNVEHRELHNCENTLVGDTGRFYCIDDPGLIKIGPQKVQIDRKYEELYT